MALWGMLSSAVGAMDPVKPSLLEDEYYKEYWEQHFLFDDGTFVTSQFLMANFPWPVGKDHGIMIATIVGPDGTRSIIKNGRDLGEWGFDEDKLNIFIHTHRIKNEGGKHHILVGKKEYNQVEAFVTSSVPPLDHNPYKGKKGIMESSFYLPYFKGQGKWRYRPGEDQPYIEGTGNVQGFGTHVLFTDRVEKLLANWLRVSGLTSDEHQIVPFLSAMDRADGSQDIILTLKGAKGSRDNDKSGDLIHFNDIRLDYRKIRKGEDGSSFPTVINLSGQSAAGSLRGTIQLTRKIDHFNINDHLNFFEKSFASTSAVVINYRYIAEYDLTYTTGTDIQHFTGQALSEYKDILPPKKKKKKRKKRGRR